MVFTATCPRLECRQPVIVPATLTNVTFVGLRNNVQVQCPWCGNAFDATGGGDGTFSTLRGRLVRVAARLAKIDAATLAALKADLERAEAQHADETAIATVQALGMKPPRGGWLANRETRMELYTVLGLLIAVVTVILSLRQESEEEISPSDIEKLIEQFSKKETEQDNGE